MTGRTAVLFLTHLWNPVIALRFERLRREIGDAADVRLMLQRSVEAGQAVASLPEVAPRTVLFQPPGLQAALGYPFFKGRSIVPGSTHFPVLVFAQKYRAHDFYLIVEHDVEFTGHWGDLLAALTAAEPDFAASHVRTYEQHPDWFWWSRYAPSVADRDWAEDKRNLRNSFNPLYAISRKSLEMVDQAHRDGWRAHYELLLATILCQRGCRVLDLAEIGDFYTGGEPDFYARKARDRMSSMRWRPNIRMREIAQRSTGQTLFHPVKGAWHYDGTRIVRPAPASGDEAEP